LALTAGISRRLIGSSPAGGRGSNRSCRCRRGHPPCSTLNQSITQNCLPSIPGSFCAVPQTMVTATVVDTTNLGQHVHCTTWNCGRCTEDFVRTFLYGLGGRLKYASSQPCGPGIVPNVYRDPVLPLTGEPAILYFPLHGRHGRRSHVYLY
jgi:hypothetical protein